MTIIRRVANQANNLTQRALIVVLRTSKTYDELRYVLLCLVVELLSAVYQNSLGVIKSSRAMHCFYFFVNALDLIGHIRYFVPDTLYRADNFVDGVCIYLRLQLRLVVFELLQLVAPFF